MAKVTINGEVFDFDRSRKPLAEMLALEKALGVPYGQWESDLQNGSARAMAGFVWLVWRREGREVRFADIESGEVDVNFAEFEIAGDPEPEEDMGPTLPAAGNAAADSANPRGGNGSSRTAPGRLAFCEIGIRPWEIGLLDVTEFEALIRHFQAEQQRKA